MPRISPLGRGSSINWRHERRNVPRKPTKQPDGTMTSKPDECLVRVADEHGNRVSKVFPITAWSKDGSACIPKAAELWAGEKRGQAETGAELRKADLEELAEFYLQTLEDNDASERYLADSRAIVRALCAAGIRDLRAKDFGDRVRGFIGKLATGWTYKGGDAPKNAPEEGESLSATTKNLRLAQVRAICTYAFERRRVPFPPLAGIRDFEGDETIKAGFTIDDVRTLTSDAWRHDGWWLPTVLMAYTGMRSQEAMHLRWEWINWAERVVYVKLASPEHGEKWHVKGNKERMIELQPELARILWPMRQESGWVIPSPYMRAAGACVRLSGKPGKVANYGQAFQRYMGRCGVTVDVGEGSRSPHSMRHWFISVLIAQRGCNVSWIQRAVGHESSQTTEEYAPHAQRYEQQVREWPTGRICLRDDPATLREPQPLRLVTPEPLVTAPAEDIVVLEDDAAAG